jgi:very-short-patch-repair endonuclease
MPPRTFDDWVASGRLIRVYRGVYAVGHPQSNPVNRGHAALLAGGGRSWLAGACALVLWGVWRRWPSRWEVVIASDRRPSGLIVHQSKTLLKRDVTTLQGLRVTSTARTLLDTAPRLTEKQRERAVNDLRLRGVLTNEQLRDVVERNVRYAGAPLLRPLIETAQREPTRSEMEDAFLKLVRTYDLPTPQINVHVGGERVDAYFPDHSLIVELDGWATHRKRFASDRRRDADILAATGIPTVRLPYEDTTAAARIPTTVARLRALVSARNRMGPTLATPRSG